jgi:hypothetical protein
LTCLDQSLTCLEDAGRQIRARRILIPHTFLICSNVGEFRGPCKGARDEGQNDARRRQAARCPLKRPPAPHPTRYPPNGSAELWPSRRPPAPPFGSAALTRIVTVLAVWRRGRPVRSDRLAALAGDERASTD